MFNYHESGYTTEHVSTSTFHDVAFQEKDKELEIVKQELENLKIELDEKTSKIKTLTEKCSEHDNTVEVYKILQEKEEKLGREKYIEIKM